MANTKKHVNFGKGIHRDLITPVLADESDGVCCSMLYHSCDWSNRNRKPAMLPNVQITQPQKPTRNNSFDFLIVLVDSDRRSLVLILHQEQACSGN